MIARAFSLFSCCSLLLLAGCNNTSAQPKEDVAEATIPPAQAAPTGRPAVATPRELDMKAPCSKPLMRVKSGLAAMIDTKETVEVGISALAEVEALRGSVAQAVKEAGKGAPEPGNVLGDYIELAGRFDNVVIEWTEAARADDLNRLLGAQQDLRRIGENADTLLKKLAVMCAPPAQE